MNTLAICLIVWYCFGLLGGLILILDDGYIDVGFLLLSLLVSLLGPIFFLRALYCIFKDSRWFDFVIWQRKPKATTQSYEKESSPGS